MKVNTRNLSSTAISATIGAITGYMERPHIAAQIPSFVPMLIAAVAAIGTLLTDNEDALAALDALVVSMVNQLAEGDTGKYQHTQQQILEKISARLDALEGR